MKYRSVTLLILCMAAVTARNAYSFPRLLETFPKDEGSYIPELGAGPITFVFSEPMDPSSFVLPNKDNSNPDRSFEIRPPA